MTKSLTEQWKDGELPDRCYYVVHRTNKFPGDDEIEIVGTEYLKHLRNFNGTDRAEVLAPVPSYQTWKEFQQHFVDSLELEVKLKKAYEELEKQSIEIVGLKTEKEQLVRKTEQLEKQLAIATKALKKLTRDCNKWELARKALKEIEEVK